MSWFIARLTIPIFPQFPCKVVAAICELFDEPDLVGLVLSARARQVMISIWNRDNQSESVRFAIG